MRKSNSLFNKYFRFRNFRIAEGVFSADKTRYDWKIVKMILEKIYDLTRIMANYNARNPSFLIF